MEQLLYKPNLNKGDFNFAMAFPEKEEFALSSLGYMWLFKTADTINGINAARISTDKPFCNFKKIDAISFSLSFDFDFMGVFEILEKNKIPFYAKDRDENTPLIFAGGAVVTTNPLPYNNIFDFMIIGDGESVLPKILDILKGKRTKSETLKILSSLDGVYIPHLSKTVKKITEPLNNVIYTPILSDKSYFKDTFIIEVQRGCMNRCAFCTASYLNLPFRHYEYNKIIETIEFGLKYTNKIALLGAQISAHPEFTKIIEYIKNKIKNGTPVELGISSMRTDAITPELVQTLVLGGQKTSTIAIEAASERLRKFINKNLSEEQIINAVKVSRENGLKGLKIYSMIGIPTETEDDIKEFIRLAEILKLQNKGFDITFSFSTFVPKPQTPFQRLKREATCSLEKKQKYIEKELAKLGISSKFSSAKWDYWQTLLSRGSSNLGELMVEVYKKGGTNGSYKSAIKELKIDIHNLIDGYSPDEILPWNLISNFTPTVTLDKEYTRLANKI